MSYDLHQLLCSLSVSYEDIYNTADILIDMLKKETLKKYPGKGWRAERKHLNPFTLYFISKIGLDYLNFSRNVIHRSARTRNF